MNTLQDLRGTLDRHAHEVHDEAGVARAAAPDSMSALGWTYVYRGAEHTDGDSLEVDLPASDTPRLLSWATAGTEQDVEVRFPGTRWDSEAGDYDDFVQVPGGPATTVRVSGPEGLTLATYDVDLADPPDGIGSGAMIYRSDVAGRRLLAAGVGEPGQASVTIDVPPTRGTAWAGELCDGVPEGVSVRITFGGRRGYFSSGLCSGSAFDPGVSADYGFRTTGRHQQLIMTLREDGEPVADGEYPDLRIGLGAYASAGPTLAPAGLTRDRTVEDSGRVWEVADVVTGSGAELPTTTTRGHGMTLVDVSVRVTLDGRPGPCCPPPGRRAARRCSPGRASGSG